MSTEPGRSKRFKLMSSRKRSLSAHQKQMRFLTFLFAAVAVLAVTGLLLLLNIASHPATRLP